METILKEILTALAPLVAKYGAPMVRSAVAEVWHLLSADNENGAPTLDIEKQVDALAEQAKQAADEATIEIEQSDAQTRARVLQDIGADPANVFDDGTCSQCYGKGYVKTGENNAAGCAACKGTGKADAA